MPQIFGFLAFILGAYASGLVVFVALKTIPIELANKDWKTILSNSFWGSFVLMMLLMLFSFITNWNNSIEPFSDSDKTLLYITGALFTIELTCIFAWKGLYQKSSSKWSSFKVIYLLGLLTIYTFFSAIISVLQYSGLSLSDAFQMTFFKVIYSGGNLYNLLFYVFNNGLSDFPFTAWNWLTDLFINVKGNQFLILKEYPFWLAAILGAYAGYKGIMMTFENLGTYFFSANVAQKRK